MQSDDEAAKMDIIKRRGANRPSVSRIWKDEAAGVRAAVATLYGAWVKS